MQLKRLNILGFKTFADKTEIEIDGGMTAVVGPNGSGKSNIVDALLWVLGEQNPRLLRGTTAQDVIFAGTDKRKPLGMAEVRLTIDNSDGSLPINFAEVTITRRAYRSGESQYLLNNAPCRLKDIVELFLDTGVGKGAYAFVSQSEIDAVLTARPEDRRELFEEAAGIKKYRYKKREALRKLESAEANLNRVRDILRELDIQREPMERESQIARRFLSLQERLHEIEIGMLTSELQKADYELFAARQEQEEDQAGLLRIDAELVRLERAADGVRERLTHVEEEIESVRVRHQAALSSVERNESLLALTSQRLDSAARSREQLKAELAEMEERRKRFTEEIEWNLAERETIERDETAVREQWAARKAVVEELDRAVAGEMRTLHERRTERMRLGEERARIEAGLRSGRERLAEATVRGERAANELKALDSAANEARTRREEADSRVTETSGRREQASAERREREERLTALRAELVGIRSNLDTARRVQAEQSARLATLTELQQSHEGFYQGVRAVLNARRSGELTGSYAPVVDLLTVPERYRVAIEVALGGSLQDIVTDTEAEAKSAIGWLKTRRAGRATFLPLPLLRPGNALELRDNVPGVEGVATDLVEFDARYAPVARLLLGRALVVEDMDRAIDASRRLNGWGKIVTLDGELLTPGGALTGGSLQGRGAHLVGRKGEMDDLKTKVPKLRADVERLTAALDSNVRTASECEGEAAEAAKRESTLSAELASAEAGCASADRDLARLARDRTDREAIAGTVANDVARLTTEVERLECELTVGAVENESADEALTQLNADLEALAHRRDESRAQAVASEVEVSRLRERREALTREIAGDKASLASLEEQSRRKSDLSGAAETERVDSGAERERLAAQLANAREQAVAVGAELECCRQNRQALLDESFAANAAIKETAQRRVDLTRGLHAAELAIARLDVQASQATERLRDEYGISKEEALARPDDVAVDKQTAVEVARLRREIRGMGQVNTGAIAEFDRLSERFDFLYTQEQDLEKSRGLLLETIAEIDESTRGVFIETFESVRREFDRLFVRLFGGGSTRLVLTKPDDLLETGIEVIAQPPGKKAQHLSLLSGGERALTATALLFAFLAVRPSPFVLLDEVDAPLDGANVERFTQLVREFSERSQFLIITHNPTTMESAPTWYGVTMREPGVSSILSYRVPREAAISAPDTAVVLSPADRAPMPHETNGVAGGI